MVPWALWYVKWFSLIYPLWLLFHCIHRFTLNFLLSRVLSVLYELKTYCLLLNSLLDLGRIEVDCIASDLCLGLHTNVHVLKMFHEIFLLVIVKHMVYSKTSLSAFLLLNYIVLLFIKYIYYFIKLVTMHFKIAFIHERHCFGIWPKIRSLRHHK